MKQSHKYMSIIVSAVAVLAMMVVTLMFGDYFFDLNDDVLMKDILSGAYTGTPEGHNIQMLYPISGFISLLYKTGINLDWYGIFLCFIQYLCLFFMLSALISRASDTWKKILCAISFILVCLGFFWPHLLYVQYTVVCGLMSGTAAFLILTAKENKKNNIIALILLFVAYLIRSEMLLLTLPMVGVAILIKWALSRLEYYGDSMVSHVGEKKKLFRRYLGLCLTLVLGLLVCGGLHKLAYSRADWKEFNRLFDNRTELYDFQYIPDYAQNKDFYDSIGLSESEQQLLVNYNFALDDEINADTLGAIAEYAAQTKSADAPLTDRLRKAFSLYVYRMHYVAAPVFYEYPMTDFPWNVCVILLYLAVFATLFIKHKGEAHYKKVGLGLIATLIACRSVLWLYIIIRGRDPIRITHPLYLIEMVILTGMLMLVLGSSEAEGYKKSIESKIAAVIAIVLGIVGAIAIPMQGRVINHENMIRQAMLDRYQALYDYFDANKESYYLIDVYTSVSLGEAVTEEAATFSEKMFERVDNSFANHDLLGGWASKSPIYRQKLEKAGYTNVQDALLSEGVYYVQNKTFDNSWLIDYYHEKGVEVSLDKIDEIADVFEIYKVEKLN